MMNTRKLILFTEIGIWVLFFVFLFISRIVLAIIEPDLVDAITLQLFIEWIGFSIIIGILLYYAERKKIGIFDLQS